MTGFVSCINLLYSGRLDVMDSVNLDQILKQKPVTHSPVQLTKHLTVRLPHVVAEQRKFSAGGPIRAVSVSGEGGGKNSPHKVVVLNDQCLTYTCLKADGTLGESQA